MLNENELFYIKYSRLFLAFLWFLICLSIFSFKKENTFFPLFSWDLYSAAQAEPFFYDISFSLKSGQKIRLSKLKNVDFNQNKLWDLRKHFLKPDSADCPSPENYQLLTNQIHREVKQDSSFEVTSASLIFIRASLAEFLFLHESPPAEVECFDLF